MDSSEPSIVYEPREDSALLQRVIRDFFITHPGIHAETGLDMGTGSGILALTLCNYCREVLAVDVNPTAVDATLQAAEKEHATNLTVSLSDLFSTATGIFDIIVFNPPYLPFDPQSDAKDIALSAAPDDAKANATNVTKGNELIIKFVKEAKTHLSATGNILLLFSSLSSPQEILEEIKTTGFLNELLATEKHFMEELYVYHLWC